MSLLKKNIFFNTLLSLSQILFPLITFPYASRVLGPQAIGAVSFADNFTIYFLIFSALGIPMYGIREIAKVKDDPKRLGTVFSELLIIHLCTSLIAVFILFCISYFNERLRLNFGLYQIGMAIVLGSVFMAEWFFQGIEKFQFIAVRSVCIRLFTILLLFLFVHSVKDRDIYYGLNLVSVVIGAAINMYAIFRMVKISWKGTVFKRHFRPLLIIFSNSIITSVYLVFDTIILGFLTDDLHVGYYSAAMRLSKISMAVIGVLGAVLLPRLTLAFQQEDLTNARMLISKSLSFVIFLSIPIALGTLCLSKEIIYLFAGNKYANSVYSLDILCFIVIVIGLAQVFSNQILLPLHKEKNILYASLFGMVVSLGLNFLLIPVFKHVGAAISSFSTEFVVTIVLFIYAQKAMKFDFPFKPFFQSLFTALFFFVFRYVCYQFTDNILIVVLGTIISSGLFYALMQLFVWKNKNVLETLAGISSLRFLHKYTGNG
ncbi:Membrane protein involved in the export of O-antigen and teichoic acid [Pedobacter westerhofensis]|uniref:Membrane protein involved in the export of O-antigen and teichoic acid n=1 Tax=Pedobacter westerhofensis TaxID=425512 RepID=A0A521CB96_9SPHI|nr:flippase [Pedobacter westerhofensis]SMO56081.1 Membrane protein involved in the export of O-antigen and teichoic acid [Pedobacter westerhofensis]